MICWNLLIDFLMNNIRADRKKDIAIIGMSGRFPQSDNIREFWNNLVAGKELVRHYELEELKALGVDEKRLKDPNYIRSSSELTDPENFDYSFFGYTKGEAELMDPQIRLMHQQVWWALEDAACIPDEYTGKIGVYLAASDNLNWRAHALMHPNNEVGSFMSRRLADKSFISTLVSYNLNLKGPSFHTDTACSSSLTAVHFACRSLLMKECSIALAGGATLITTTDKGYWYEDGMVASRDGHCRAFDKDASGTLFGEGLGVVVLKRLEDAIQDKDHIYAVIRSTAVNNDGRRKVGYTAPSVSGQAECITLAHKIAGVEPESITYVEAHGTGTRIGDAIEIEALNQAFNNNTKHSCAIGTVKSNLGHLDAVAGVVGLIKAALSLKNKMLLPSINFNTPHPDISWGAGPFYVNNQLKAWERKAGQELRAGVSSFGIGGTNAHAILEEEPVYTTIPSKKQHRLLVFSAKTPAALNNYQSALKEFIQNNEGIDLARLAYTLQKGRKHFQHRDFLVYDGEHKVCGQFAKDAQVANTVSKQAGKVVFMFSGGGSQYFEMAAQLYANESFFAAQMDEGLEKLKVKTGWDFKKLMGYTQEEDADAELINDIKYMLPALFLVEYAIAKLLIKTGIRPDYMIGHSLGEYVAACISGVFSFDDALDLVIKRAALTDTVPEGGMVGVELTENEVRPYLTARLSIAAINMPDSCVISGPKEDIKQFIEVLTHDNISFTELKISVAAHSSVFDAILDDYRKVLQHIKFSAPQIPFVSNLSGKEITAAEATSPEYWVRHLRNTVNFLSGLGCLLEKGTASYIEIGSGGILTSFLKSHPLFKQDNLGVNVLRHPKEVLNDHAYYLNALGKLWANGVAIDWDAFNNHEKYQKISAPGYVFDKTALKVRVDPFRQMMAGGAVWNSGKRNLQESLYAVNWKRAALLHDHQQPTVPEHYYLVFTDADTQLYGVMHQLKTNANIIEVRQGNAYEASPSFFTIDPFKQEDYEKLFSDLDERRIAINQVIYNWRIAGDEDLLASCIPATLLCQQLILNQVQNLKKFTFIADFGWHVLGNEAAHVSLNLAKETAEMIIRNNAGAFFSTIDIDAAGSGGKREREIKNDIQQNFTDAAIAYRNTNRWIRFFDNLKVNGPGQTGILNSRKKYLIVNGTGRTGYILSRYLSEKYNAGIIISGRQQQIESLNGSRLNNAHYYVADAADTEVFLQMLNDVEAAHGKINGVIFTSDDQKISDVSDLSTLISIQNKKLQPVQNLYTAFKDRQIDFVWMPLRLSSELHHITEHIYVDAYSKLLASSPGKAMHNWHFISLDDVCAERDDEQEIPALFELSLSHNIREAMLSFQNLNELKKKVQRKETKAAAAENNPAAVNLNYVAPETELEKNLCELWQSFLAPGNIGVQDNFFELGGNSLKAMTLLKRIQKQYNVQLTLKDFYAKPTVELLAQEINIATLLKTQKNTKQRSTLKI